MRLRLGFIVVLFSSGLVLAQNFSFDKTRNGALPSEWAAYMTHSGGAPQWQVLKDVSTAGKPKALAQLSEDPSRSRFPLAIYKDVVAKDGTLSVNFKTVSGKIDQAAGLVWRFVDADNYYLVRANALEDNVVLYKVEKGTRTALAPRGTVPGTYGVKHQVPPKVWNALSVTFKGKSFVVSLNGEKLFEVEDETFGGDGRIGLWTKADSVTYFRGFQFQSGSTVSQK